MAQFLGYQSSHSGQQALDRLIVRGLIERGKDGWLRLGDRAADILTGRAG